MSEKKEKEVTVAAETVKLYLKDLPLAKIDKEEFEEAKETPEGKIKSDKRIAFEAYFEVLKSKNKNIKDHHKEPIRAYIKQVCGSDFLFFEEGKFDEFLKNY